MVQFLFFFLITTSYFAVFANDTGLVIIDMQPEFYETDGYHNNKSNAEKIHRLEAEVLELIYKAKAENAHIYLFEYFDYGSTNKKILQALEGYTKRHLIIKHNDSIFGPTNLPNDLSTETFFKSFGTRKLVMTGANGDYCVYDSISDALARGFHVRTYPGAIASFVRPQYNHPFFYEPWERPVIDPWTGYENWIPHKKFRQVDEAREIDFKSSSPSRLKCSSLFTM